MPIDLSHVYTDRCKVIKLEPAAHIEGETHFEETETDWIPARFSPRSANERRSFGRTENVAGFQLICALFDASGNPVRIEAQDELEVEMRVFSAYQPQGRFRVVDLVQRPRDLTPEELLIYVLLEKKDEY